MFRDCGEDSRDYARGKHKTVLGTQRAFDECFLSLLIFHLTTQTQQLFSHHSLTPSSPLTTITSLLIQIPFFSLRVSQLSLLQRGSFWSQFPLLPTWDFLILSRILIPLCLHFPWNTYSVTPALLMLSLSYCHIRTTQWVTGILHIGANNAWDVCSAGEPTSQPVLWDMPIVPSNYFIQCDSLPLLPPLATVDRNRDEQLTQAGLIRIFSPGN